MSTPGTNILYNVRTFEVHVHSNMWDNLRYIMRYNLIKYPNFRENVFLDSRSVFILHIATCTSMDSQTRTCSHTGTVKCIAITSFLTSFPWTIYSTRGSLSASVTLSSLANNLTVWRSSLANFNIERIMRIHNT